MDIYDRVPPQSLEAERAVLGSCLLDREVLGSVIEMLRPDDFYDAKNRAAFEAMFIMYGLSKPVDIITVKESLINNKTFDDELTVQPFLAGLIDEVPTTANALYHAEIVREKSIRRRLIEAGSKIVNLAYSNEYESAMMLDEAERLIFEISQNKKSSDFKKLSDILAPAFKKLETAISNYNAGEEPISNAFKSGFDSLDSYLIGFPPGSLNIIAARPSMGKTAFAMNIAQFGGGDNRDNIPVLIFSLEMSGEQLVQRMLAAEANVDLTSINNGSVGSRDWGILTNAADKLSKRLIFIDDSSMLTSMEFRAKCRRFKSRYPSLGLIIVDYLQLMRLGGKSSGSENRQYEVAEISRMLKGVARELECPVIALSQLSRTTEKREDKKPVLSDLRDSGAIEQDADVVMFLFRADYYEDTDPSMNSSANISISKNRNGPTQQNIPLVFHREITRFYDEVNNSQPGYEF